MLGARRMYGPSSNCAKSRAAALRRRPGKSSSKVTSEHALSIGQARDSTECFRAAAMADGRNLSTVAGMAHDLTGVVTESHQELDEAPSPVAETTRSQMVMPALLIAFLTTARSTRSERLGRSCHSPQVRRDRVIGMP
jgi:hypothetical protein